MTERPFDALRRALHDISPEPNHHTPHSRPDAQRQARAGAPEIIFAAGKEPDHVLANLVTLAKENGRAIATRCPEGLADYLAERLPAGYALTTVARARAVVVAREGCSPPRIGGRVGILTAGTSDAPVAAEAELVARELGCETRIAFDVGVAGLHRLVAPLEAMTEWDADVLIVVAGMDGALPSVVAGLVAVPVIGVPTSTGYGYGGRGEGALMTMLQTCAPGLVVVNIDNGVGAGISAALIANRVAAREGRDSATGSGQESG
ncbi:MAG TPA: nickel pincer cofactor biosynthesis protein LarB [Thermomicrobiales bacterium]